MLEFKDVTKSFKDGNRTIEAVKPTTLKFDKSELIGIIGPSGSGKSTFLTMAGALQTPSSGEIIINDKDITHLSQNNWPAHVWKISALFCKPQTSFLFNGQTAIHYAEKAKERCAQR